PQPSWEYPTPSEQGYADRAAYAFWAGRDPIASYAARLLAEQVIGEGDLAGLQAEADALVEAQARRGIQAPWPGPPRAGRGVVAGEAPRVHVEALAERPPRAIASAPPPLDPGPPPDAHGRTFLDAVMLGVADALRADPRVFVYGEDVGGRYGNAFLLL